MPSVSRCKCVVIGDEAVGKTSIIKMLLGAPNQFPKKYQMTNGVEISSKTLRIPNTDDIVELFIYDCSGKNVYREIVEKVWANNVSLIVGVFDVTNEESFRSLQNWLADLNKCLKKPETTIGIILGNKIDLTDRKIVSSDDAHQIAKKNKMRYFDCSAKDMIGVEESFLHLISNWHDSHSNDGSKRLNIIEK